MEERPRIKWTIPAVPIHKYPFQVKAAILCRSLVFRAASKYRGGATNTEIYPPKEASFIRITPRRVQMALAAKQKAENNDSKEPLIDHQSPIAGA